MSVHINAKKGDFAKVVLMPGDPLRAKWIATYFLKNAKEVCDVRGMLGYTGYTEHGKRVSVMASGMGQPSIGIYSYELFKEYGVEAIIRVGTCGAFSKKLNIKDVVIASTSSTDFNWVMDFHLDGFYSAGADYELLSTAVEEAKKTKLKFMVGNIFSEGKFYHFAGDKKAEPWWKPWDRLGTLGCEMESYALYCNAAVLGKKALAMFTVSDHFQKSEVLSSKERQSGLTKMIYVALKVAEKFA